MIFGDIKELIEKNRYYISHNRLNRVVYAEDVLSVLAKGKEKTEEEIERELRFVLEYAGTLCLNLQGISVMDFLLGECQFPSRRDKERVREVSRREGAGDADRDEDEEDPWEIKAKKEAEEALPPQEKAEDEAAKEEEPSEGKAEPKEETEKEEDPSPAKKNKPSPGKNKKKPSQGKNKKKEKPAQEEPPAEEEPHPEEEPPKGEETPEEVPPQKEQKPE